MPDEINTAIPSSLENLVQVIRQIERETKQPSQIMVRVGNERYLVGDITQRQGSYALVMFPEVNSFNHSQLEHEKKANPYLHLSGNYASFEALTDAVRTEAQDKDWSTALHLIGSPEHGYGVSLPGVNLGRAGGQTYNPIGTITFPLLLDDEAVPIRKIER